MTVYGELPVDDLPPLLVVTVLFSSEVDDVASDSRVATDGEFLEYSILKLVLPYLL